MFLWSRPKQMSHRREFNSFFSENGAKMIIPANRESYRGRSIYPAALIGTDYFVAYQLNTIILNYGNLFWK